jgi:hypothetical protein
LVSFRENSNLTICQSEKASVNEPTNSIRGSIMAFRAPFVATPKSISFGFALTLLVSLVACAASSSSSTPSDQPNVTIQSIPNLLSFSSTIPAEQTAAVNEAVSTLFTLPLDSADAAVSEMAHVMGNQDVTAPGLQTWMQARVAYILEGGFDLQHHAAFSPAPFVYQNPNDYPDVMRPQPTTPADTEESRIVMSNVGAAVYSIGKQNSKLVSVDLPGIGTIFMKSPRTGLLEIGPGLFPDLGGMTVQNIALDIFRVATLFHEARHSDGHGHSMGFMHTTCPTGDYKGMAACDIALNGPYSVGASVHKALMNKCALSGNCTALSQQLLQIIYADQANRVLDLASAPKDLSADTLPGQFWDDAPEGTR